MRVRPSKIADYFCKQSIEDLQRIQDIGPTVAQSIYDWFHDKHNIELLEKLDKAGIEIGVSKLSAKGGQTSSDFLNKTFVLTGELDSLTRDEAKAKIRELGGDVSSSVSKNTDYVVVGKSPGTKYDKAKELGVKTIGEQEFLKMIR
jgi:DNA ligase (NAD+)